MSTKVSTLSLSKMEDFVKFNQKAYLERKDFEKRFRWQFLDNPFLENKDNLSVLLCHGEKGEITGQISRNFFDWHFRGNTYKCYCTADFYVLQTHRRQGLGRLLAKEAIQGDRPWFTVGIAKNAQRLFSSLGAKGIGSMGKFIWLRNPIAPLLVAINLAFKNTSSLVHRKNVKPQFPATLSSNGLEFKLIKQLDNWDEYYWDDTLGFSRSLEFLRWRFFNNFRKYYFYLADGLQKPVYFVVRKCFWKGLVPLLIVDYRIPQGDINSWNSILKLSKVLAKITHCDGVMTGSSHQFFDKGLKENLFFKVGKKSLLIMTTAKIDVVDTVISERKLLYTTMADSDAELYMDELE